MKAKIKIQIEIEGQDPCVFESADTHQGLGGVFSEALQWLRQVAEARIKLEQLK